MPFIGYPERSKGFRFYCSSHTTRIVETRHAEFLENGDLSGSGELKKIDLEENMFYVSNLVIQKGEAQQPPIEANDAPEIAEPPPNVEPHIIENYIPKIVQPLRRSERPRKPINFDDFITYLNEIDYDSSKINDPISYKEAITSAQST